MTRTPHVIGIPIPTSSSYGRDVVHGIMRYANLQRRWIFLEDFYNASHPIDLWKRCDGVLLPYMSADALEQFRANVPHIVCVSSGVDNQRFPTVSVDDAEVGRLAAEHLIDCRLESFGFYSLRGHTYAVAQRRLAGFTTALLRQAYTCSNFEWPAHLHSPAAPTEPNTHWIEPHWPAVIHWLSTLPKPVGILCTEDKPARDLAAICRHAGIAVPDQVAILGVNNDSLLCESAWPPLSSMDTNFERIGYIAAEHLDRLLTGEKLAPADFSRRLPPAGVQRRASTDLLAVDDPTLAEAVRYIRVHACDPCTVEDVVRHVAIARRRLEKLCTAKLGRSLHEQIVSVRMQTARRILLQSDRKIPEVARACGLSTTQFNRLFLQQTGQTPTEWRFSSQSMR